MDDENRRDDSRVSVGLKIKLKYSERQTFIDRFSVNLSRTGMFLRARDPLAIGARVHFEYRLSDDTRILRGVGVVRWSRTADNASLDDPPGMGIEFVELDTNSTALIAEIVASRGEGARAPKTQAPVVVDQAAAPRLTSSMPQVGDAGGSDTALDAIDALGLGGSDSATTLDAATTLFIDLSAESVRTTLLKDSERDDSVPVASSSAVLLHDWASCLDPDRLPARIKALVARSGASFEQRDGIWQVATESGSQAIGTLVQQAIAETLVPYRPRLETVSETRVLVPALTSPAARARLHSILTALDLPDCRVIDSAEAVVRAARVKAAPVIATVWISAFEARVTLIRASGSESWSLFGDGYRDCDRRLRRHASFELLRAHGIDIEDDPFLGDALRDQLEELRRTNQPEALWSVSVAGASVTMPAEIRRELLLNSSERIGISIEEHLSGEIPVEPFPLVVAASEPLWIGLTETLEERLHCTPVLVQEDDWTRLLEVSS